LEVREETEGMRWKSERRKGRRDRGNEMVELGKRDNEKRMKWRVHTHDINS